MTVVRTMEELRAVEPGQTITVNRPDNLWTRTEDGFHQGGLTLGLDVFTGDMTQGRITTGPMLAEGVVLRDRLDYLLLEDDNGWWCAQVSTRRNPLYVGLIHFDQGVTPPGIVVDREQINWGYDLMLSAGRYHLAERQEVSAFRLRVQEALAPGVTSGEPIQPETLAGVMRSLGLQPPETPTKVNVTVEVHALSRRPVGAQLLHGFPSGVRAPQEVEVQWGYTLTIPMMAPDDADPCEDLTDGIVQAALVREAGQAITDGLVDLNWEASCPRD